MPQNEVLGHPRIKAFLSDCGSNSMYEVLDILPYCVVWLVGSLNRYAYLPVRCGVTTASKAWLLNDVCGLALEVIMMPC